MSDQKTNPQTLGPTTGAFIKYEATQLTRVAVSAAKGTKAGTFVDYPLRAGKKLLDQRLNLVLGVPEFADITSHPWKNATAP